MVFTAHLEYNYSQNDTITGKVTEGDILQGGLLT